MIKNYALFIVLTICSLTIQAQNPVLGNITNEAGIPLKDVNVDIMGISKGASTNENGNYIIENLQEKTYYINVSHIEYVSQTIKITIVSGENEMNFILKRVSNQLNEVIVSAANRRLQNIQKTETSISVINAKEVGQLQIKEFGELNSIAPNFNSYDDGGTGIFTIIASRGISTIDVNPIIGVYVDDVPYFSTLAFPLALSNVDQIEVLRGPQGTLYGRNALAGVLKITTKKPTNRLSGFATVGFGNLNSKEFAFALNTPIVKNKLFFRANTSITDRDGFVFNEFNNRNLQDRETQDVNFRLKYFANDNLSMALHYNLQRRASDAYAFVLPSQDSSLQDILRDSPYKVNFDTDIFQKAFTQNLAFTLKYDFKKFTINTTTSYQTTQQEALREFDFTTFDIQSLERLTHFDNFSQEIRLNSSTDTALYWTAGVFLYQNKEKRNDVTFYGVDAGLARPDLAPLAPFQQLDDPVTKRKGVAVFGQATYNITDKLSLSAGLRADYEDVEASIVRSYNTSVIPENNFSEEADFDALSPKFSIGYDINDNIFLFANFAKGFRPGSINTFVSNPEDAAVEPEKSSNYELGVKTNLLENRLKLNLTTFYTNYIDQQVFTVLDPINFVIGNDNIGESRSYGLELESKWFATRGLNLTLNLGYLNTEVTKYDPIDFFTGETADFSGKALPLSPKFNGNLNINYKLPINKKINLETSVDYNYQSDIYFDIPNQMQQEAYGILNGRIGITSKRLDFYVWGKNITDETYFSYGYGVGGFNPASFGLPQTYGATLTAKF